MKNESPGRFKAQGLSLRDAVVVLFRHKWLIILTFLTTAAAAFILAYSMSDNYESRMKILVRNMRSDVIVAPDQTDASSNDTEISESQIVSEIELLKSRDLLEQVVKNTNLARFETKGEPTAQDVEKAVYRLEKELQISPVKKANIIEVNYTSKSPEIAATVLKQLAELYLEKHLKLHRPPGTHEFFKDRADEYKSDLRDAENKFSAFQQQMNVVSLDRQKELMLSRLTDTQAKLSDLNGTIKEADKRVAELKRQLGGMETRISTQSRVLPNQDSVERFNTMLVELKNRRTQLLAKFQPEDRLVKEVDEQIRTTTAALAKASQTTYSEQSSDINPLRQSLETELARVKVEQSGRNELRENLKTQVEQYQSLLTKLEKATTPHDNLSRQVKQADENYQLYAKKQEESRIADELDKQKISNVTIAEAPTVPRVPYKSNRLLTALVGLGLGLMLGLGGAVTAEFFRETVHTPRELEGLSGAPVLATFPHKSYFETLAGVEGDFDEDFGRDFENTEFADDEFYELNLNEKDRSEFQPVFTEAFHTKN